MDIRDHTFLITGAASGLGAACARHLAAAGAQLVLADTNRHAFELAAELGDHVCFIHTDVTQEADVEHAVQMACETFGRLDGVVHCAGISRIGKLLDNDGKPNPLEPLHQVLEVNLTGTVNVARYSAAAMARQEAANADGERGVLINIGSIAASEGQVGQSAYAASKAGVAGLTLPLARELARYGIRVLTLAPGVFDTPIMDPVSPEVLETLRQQTPFPKRMGRPEELARLVAHCIENTMLNGATLRIDGALRMR